MLYLANILASSPSSTTCDRCQRSKILLWNYLSLIFADMIQSCKYIQLLANNFCPIDPFQIPWNTLLKLLQLNLCWESLIMQVHSTTCWPFYRLIRTFHMGGSTLLKWLHLAKSFPTFNYFAWRIKCKNLFLKLIPSPHSETMCENESRAKTHSQPMTSWHIILPSPQNIANYKVPRTTTRFCYHYSETNINLLSVIEIKA